MSSVLIKGMEYKTSISGPAYLSLDIDVRLPYCDHQIYLGHQDVEKVLDGAFNAAFFNKYGVFGEELTFKKVIYNGPATIILWDDGTKTVVKCKEGDPYSHEAGFALAVLKRLTGNDFHRCLREATKGGDKDERKSRKTSKRET